MSELYHTTQPYHKCSCGAERTSARVGNATYYFTTVQDLFTYVGGNIPEHSIHRTVTWKEKNFDGSTKEHAITKTTYELLSLGACQR